MPPFFIPENKISRDLKFAVSTTFVLFPYPSHYSFADPLHSQASNPCPCHIHLVLAASEHNESINFIPSTVELCQLGSCMVQFFYNRQRNPTAPLALVLRSHSSRTLSRKCCKVLSPRLVQVAAPMLRHQRNHWQCRLCASQAPTSLGWCRICARAFQRRNWAPQWVEVGVVMQL